MGYLISPFSFIKKMLSENRKLQMVQTDILVDIDRICEENNLTYYIIGGTLLGAVRHKGFIPWDDDIDIVMYREDYNKFIDIVQKEYSEKYFMQTFSTDPYYPRYIAKIRLNNTVLVESVLKNAKSHCGLYVDIFPLDHVQKTNSLDLKLRGIIIRWLFAYKNTRCNAPSEDSNIKAFLAKAFRWCTFIIPSKLINNLFDYLCQKDNKKNCSYTTNFASHFKWKKQLFENEVYGEGCRLEFEGHMFNAPNKYLTILERLYGKNFMELPPENKRITHKIIKLDFGEYDPELRTSERG